MHVYDWQAPSLLTLENGFLLEPHVAFRDIVSEWFIDGDGEANLQLGINLDDEPLP